MGLASGGVRFRCVEVEEGSMRGAEIRCWYTLSCSTHCSKKG